MIILVFLFVNFLVMFLLNLDVVLVISVILFCRCWLDMVDEIEEKDLNEVDECEL